MSPDVDTGPDEGGLGEPASGDMSPDADTGQGEPASGDTGPGEAGLLAVVNVSEGRRADVLRDLVGAAGPALLDLHHDPDHHRAVLTLGGPAAAVEAAARAVASAAVDSIDLRDHRGAHPRFGVVDVVPFVPLHPGGHPAAQGEDLSAAVGARHRFCLWAASELALPCFWYGPERSLPELRRRAFTDLLPDVGPLEPHPTAGACAVGARHSLVAYNLWLAGATVEVARRIAGAVRSPEVRTLGLAVGHRMQVSCNLVDPHQVGPAAAHAAVTAAAQRHGAAVARAELVGLLPRAVLDAIDSERWSELDVAADRTVEHRLAAGPAPCRAGSGGGLA